MTDSPTPTDGAQPPPSAHSIDERLDALMETIRTWDWREASVEAGPTADEIMATTSSLETIAAAEAGGDLEPLTSGPSMVQTANSPSVVLEPIAGLVEDPSVPSDPNSDIQSVLLEQTPRPVTVDPVVPTDPIAETQAVVLEPTPEPVTADPGLARDPEEASDATGIPSGPEPKTRAETRRGIIGRLWSRRWTKVTVLFLAAALAVILIVWGMRLANSDSSSGNGSFAPPSTTSTAPATSHAAFVAPITSAQLAQYQHYAAGLQTANGVATKAFVRAGRTPTTAQLEPVITAYRTALNLYDFQLHFIPWPASMQPAIQVDHQQLAALEGTLVSYSTINPAGTSTWLTGFHTQAATAQAADNHVRKDLGLTSSSSFP